MTPQQLKNAILQQAIQGKLVEQRAEEGTGEELYKAIQSEKQKLIQEGKLKKQKALPEITADEIPFEIPETWKWVRLGEIGVTNIGLTYKPTEVSTDGTIVLRSSNIQNGKLDLSDIVRVKKDIPETKMCKAGDILICARNGSKKLVGKAASINFEGMSFGAFMAIYRSICNEYVLYFINSTYFRNALLPETGTTTINQLTQDSLKKCVIPLPPLAEQKRIVEKIEELLPLVERYEKVWTRLEELNKKFPLDMQKAILGQAIQGKLVEQRAEEGTGEELFKAIQAEKQQLIQEGKLKKQKALPEITEDQIPFEIPETWKWVRLGEISTYSQTKKKINVAAIETPMWSLDLEDIEKESGKIIRRVMTIDRKISGEKIIFKKDQILYSKLRPYLKKILIAPDNGVCSSELVPFDMIGNCNRRFIVYLLKSAYVDFLINSVTYGVKMPRVGTDTMINLLIPLPPLAEQERIVEKIEELLPLVEKLK